MRCPETNEMAAYLDNVLTRVERARWDDHFRRCLKCRRDLAELRLLLALSPLEPDEACIVQGKTLAHQATMARTLRPAGAGNHPG